MYRVRYKKPKKSEKSYPQVDVSQLPEGIWDTYDGVHNKACISYRGGSLVFKIPDYIKIDDTVVCETRNGYLEGKVSRIVETNVVLYEKNKKVRLLSQEDTSMLERIFNIVAVKRANGLETEMCWTSSRPNIDDIVVYTSSINNLPEGLHVGKVTAVFEPGMDLPRKQPGPNNYIVDVVDTTLLWADVKKERRIAEIKAGLNNRKKLFEDRRLLEMLAAEDSIAHDLLTELDEITEGRLK